jgi:hypothetical protein
MIVLFVSVRFCSDGGNDGDGDGVDGVCLQFSVGFMALFSITFEFMARFVNSIRVHGSVFTACSCRTFERVIFHGLFLQDFPCSCCRHSGNRDHYMHGLAGRPSRRQCHRLPCLCCCFVVLFCCVIFAYHSHRVHTRTSAQSTQHTNRSTIEKRSMRKHAAQSRHIQ